MEIVRKRSNKGTIYRVMDDIPSVHYYCIEYAKTFLDEGEIIYGWYPVQEPKNKMYRDKQECMNEFERLINEQ